jgi:hypothetical protein
MRMMEGVNATMIYCKNFCKFHNVPPEQQYDNENSLCFVKKEEHFKADIISILKEVKKSILKE